MDIKITQIVNTQDLDFTGCHIKINKRGPAIVTDPAGYAARIPRADIAYLLGESFSQLAEAIDAVLASRGTKLGRLNFRPSAGANGCECDDTNFHSADGCAGEVNHAFSYQLYLPSDPSIYLECCSSCFHRHLLLTGLRSRIAFDERSAS